MAMGSKDTSSVDAFTLPSDVSETYSTLLKTFATGKTKTLEWRKWQLKQCWWMVSDNEDAILAALKQDLNRHAMESHSTDLLGLRKDIIESISHLEEWTADEIPDAGFLFGTLGKARIRKEPLGVALIIGAWNFPFLLLLSPMIAAITAGCCCLLKPSELAKESQKLLVDLVPRYLDPSAIGIVTGGPTETAALLERRFNHVFFTGSSKVARFITAATAKHLTPTVLELGGQGPAIVTKNANIDLAAKRIAAAKFSNAGQICLTVNHTFVDPDISEEFLTRLAFWNNTFMGGSQDGMARIINERNFDRLTGFLDKSNGVITYGGQTDRKGLFISPTIVEQVDFSDALLQEELFGPILPVIRADYVTAYKHINKREHPLALYIFSSKQSEIDEIISNTNSGGVTINDAFIHAGVPNAPFGGVGEAGYGYYHGKYGMLAFSHLRTIVALPTWLDKLMGSRYPPFDIRNLSKILVKNKLGFKRNENMADQKIRMVGPWTRFRPIVGIYLAVTAYWALVRMRAQVGDWCR